MHLCYDDDFVEAVVAVAASGQRPGVPVLQIRRFHAARERCYSVADPDERNAAFFKAHLDWFREWGLERLLLGLVREQPCLMQGLNTLAFRKVRSKKDEGAELYVSAENGRSAVVAMRPERFQWDAAVTHLLRHELTHLGDMLDPRFGYSPELGLEGSHPSHQRLVRERYRLLWDITIDGRLGREAERSRHRALLDHAFHFWPENRRDEVFDRLWGSTEPRHEELLAIAADPRELNDNLKPLPGALCPLCGFSTFEWADVAALDNSTLNHIHREFPRWQPELGACSRCAEVYLQAGRYANALPQ